ncbi:hypothetical protein HG530_013826 [Fusarium avenaceum]|nr:hypothetical protein HG530_013826 [Fusarium avenaceum]
MKLPARRRVLFVELLDTIADNLVDIVEPKVGVLVGGGFVLTTPAEHFVQVEAIVGELCRRVHGSTATTCRTCPSGHVFDRFQRWVPFIDRAPFRPALRISAVCALRLADEGVEVVPVLVGVTGLVPIGSRRMASIIGEVTAKFPWLFRIGITRIPSSVCNGLGATQFDVHAVRSVHEESLETSDCRSGFYHLECGAQGNQSSKGTAWKTHSRTWTQRKRTWKMG